MALRRDDRDDFTCQSCGDNRGGNLAVHHIKFWADYPELRFVLDNGLTVCRDCHKVIHEKKEVRPLGEATEIAWCDHFNPGGAANR